MAGDADFLVWLGRFRFVYILRVKIIWNDSKNPPFLNVQQRLANTPLGRAT